MKVLDSLVECRAVLIKIRWIKVAALTQALAGLKPITPVGSLAENDLKALVEDKPSLEIVEKNLILTLWEQPNPDLAKGTQSDPGWG